MEQLSPQEAVEPQFFFESFGDNFGGWDYQSFDPIFTNAFTFPTTTDFNSQFDTNTLVAEDNTNAHNLTINPDSIWQI